MLSTLPPCKTLTVSHNLLVLTFISTPHFFVSGILDIQLACTLHSMLLVSTLIIVDGTVFINTYFYLRRNTDVPSYSNFTVLKSSF
jgi:hypothetical protein